MKTSRLKRQVHPLPSESGQIQTQVLPLLPSPAVQHLHLLQQPLQMMSWTTYSNPRRALPRMLTASQCVHQLQLAGGLIHLSSLSTPKTAPPPAPWSASTPLPLSNHQLHHLRLHLCHQNVAKKAPVLPRLYLPSLRSVDICQNN